MLSSGHRHLPGPCSCLAFSSTLTKEALAAVVSGRAEGKKKRGRGSFQTTAGMQSCERGVVLCACVRPCFAADSHLSISAGT